METSVMAIEDGGWESQEPARKTARAVIANMTEQERVSRSLLFFDQELTAAIHLNFSWSVGENRVSFRISLSRGLSLICYVLTDRVSQAKLRKTRDAHTTR